MPLPSDPKKLFHYTDDSTEISRADFTNNPHWYNTFGGSKVFIITNFSEAVALCGLEDPRSLVDADGITGSSILADPTFPSQWRTLIAAGYHERHALKRFARDQLRLAKEGQPMLLSKALFSIFLLSKYALTKGIDLFAENGFEARDNRYEIKIHPAVHYVELFNNTVWETLSNAEKSDLHRRTGSIHGAYLFSEIAYKKHLTIFDIAKVIFDVTNGRPEIVSVRHNFDNWRKVRPASRFHRL